MKRLILTSLIVPFLLNGAITEEQALEFAKKYQMDSINTNIADVNYAKKFEDIANTKVINKYEKYGKSKESLEKIKKYEVLERLNQKSKDTVPLLGLPDKKKHSYKEKNPNIKTKVIKKEVYTKPSPVQTSNNSNEIELDEYEEIIIVDDEEELKEIEEIEKAKKDDELKQQEFMKSLKKQSKLFEKNGIIENEVIKIEKENAEYEKSQITLFYFVSSDLDISNFNDFIAGVDKLKSVGYNIVGRTIFRGLIGDGMDGIPNWLIENENEKDLKRTPNVKYQFNPFAFKHFSLEKVPAFAISSCKKRFKFKTCEHKYLVKGNISFQNFLEILKENNPSYKQMFFDLVEVKK